MSTPVRRLGDALVRTNALHWRNNRGQDLRNAVVDQLYVFAYVRFTATLRQRLQSHYAGPEARPGVIGDELVAQRADPRVLHGFVPRGDG